MLPVMLLFGCAVAPTPGGASAPDLLDRPGQVLVGRVQVDRGHQHAGVPGESLGEQDVFSFLVDLADRRVPHPVEASCPG